MIRLMVMAFLFIAGLSALGCQTYTSTLGNSPGRVDEKLTMATLRSIAQAQSAYSVTNSNYGSFEQLAQGSYLDERFNSSQPKVYGYILTMKVVPGSSLAEPSYDCNADPDPAENPSGRHLYISSNVTGIHVNPTRPATASDEIVQP